MVIYSAHTILWCQNIGYLHVNRYEDAQQQQRTERPSLTSIHVLQESFRFHFQDLGMQCNILADIFEYHIMGENVRSCKILHKLSESWK